MIRLGNIELIGSDLQKRRPLGVNNKFDRTKVKRNFGKFSSKKKRNLVENCDQELSIEGKNMDDLVSLRSPISMKTNKIYIIPEKYRAPKFPLNSAFLSKTKRFENIKPTVGKKLGPGSYLNDINSIQYKTMKNKYYQNKLKSIKNKYLKRRSKAEISSPEEDLDTYYCKTRYMMKCEKTEKSQDPQIFTLGNLKGLKKSPQSGLRLSEYKKEKAFSELNKSRLEAIQPKSVNRRTRSRYSAPAGQVKVNKIRSRTGGVDVFETNLIHSFYLTGRKDWIGEYEEKKMKRLVREFKENQEGKDEEEEDLFVMGKKRKEMRRIKRMGRSVDI